MTGPSPTWQELLDAAIHKLDIAELRHDRLDRQLDSYVQLTPDVPAEVQDPFEGLLTVVVAAKEQLTDALLVAHDRPITSRDRGRDVNDVLQSHSTELREAVKDWISHPIVDDMIDIRNLATHSSYEKQLRDRRWHVQDPRSAARRYEPRDLKSYAQAVHQHGRRLRDIIRRLSDELTEATTSGQPDGDVTGRP